MRAYDDPHAPPTRTERPWASAWLRRSRATECSTMSRSIERRPTIRYTEMDDQGIVSGRFPGPDGVPHCAQGAREGLLSYPRRGVRPLLLARRVVRRTTSSELRPVPPEGHPCPRGGLRSSPLARCMARWTTPGGLRPVPPEGRPCPRGRLRPSLLPQRLVGTPPPAALLKVASGARCAPLPGLSALPSVTARKEVTYYGRLIPAALRLRFAPPP